MDRTDCEYCRSPLTWQGNMVDGHLGCSLCDDYTKNTFVPQFKLPRNDALEGIRKALADAVNLPRPRQAGKSALNAVYKKFMDRLDSESTHIPPDISIDLASGRDTCNFEVRTITKPNGGKYYIPVYRDIEVRK